MTKRLTFIGGELDGTREYCKGSELPCTYYNPLRKDLTLAIDEDYSTIGPIEKEVYELRNTIDGNYVYIFRSLVRDIRI